ncbi:MAG: NAD-dependent DNA ligase LigA, partial [Clostridia bacterium]|nr:NAD-dependent DNA ligase LigA [Clostridia bacterium]
LDVETLSAERDIGSVTAENIVNFFSHPQTRELVDHLRRCGVVLEQVTTAAVGDSLSGLSFVITGTLPGMSRDEATRLIEENGGEVKSSVSARTSFLLAGSDAGSKLTKAQNLGVPILSLETLLEMIHSKQI